MRGKIVLAPYLGKGDFGKVQNYVVNRSIHQVEVLATIRSSWWPGRGDIRFRTGICSIGGKTWRVIENPFTGSTDREWHPLIRGEDDVPLLVRDLIDRSYLEETYRNPEVWQR